MRVLFNAASVQDGTGGATVTHALATGLAAQGTEVIVMLGRGVSRLRKMLLAQGVAVVDSPLPTSAGRLFWQWAFAARIARVRHCDMVLSTNIGVLGRGVPQIVLHQNSKHFRVANRWKVFLEQGARGLSLALLARAGARRASANVFISEHLRSIAEECLDSVREPVVIHNGVHLDAGVMVPRRVRLGTPLRILLVTADSPHKQNEVAITAFGDLAAKLGDNASLRVAGTGRYRGVRALADELGLKSQIDWLGNLDADAMAEEYKCADLLWHVSPEEAFGLPILEAIQFGTPVVCVDSGAAREIAGAAAVYVQPGSPMELVASTLALLDDHRRLRAMQEAGWDRIERFSWARSVADLSRLIESLASAAAGRHGADSLDAQALDSPK